MEIIDIVWAIIVRFAADFVLRIGTAEQSEKRSEISRCVICVDLARRSDAGGLSLPIAQLRTMAALLRASSRTVSKALGDQTRGYKVAVLGAAGGIGQPCGLLMKMVRAAMSLRFTSRRNPQGTDGQSAPIWRTRR